MTTEDGSRSQPETMQQPARQPARQWQRRLVGAVVATLLLVILPFGVDRALNTGNVLRGVWLGGVALSGLDREAAALAIVQHGRRLQEAPVQVRIERNLIELNPKQLGWTIDAEQTTNLALAQGRQGSLLSQYVWWLKRWFKARRLAPIARLDPAKVEDAIAKLEKRAISSPPVPGGLTIRGTSIEPEYPRRGHTVDRQAASELLLETLLATRRGVVDLPLVEHVPPLSREAVDAAAQQARDLIRGAVSLVGTDRTILRLSRRELSTLLTTEHVPGGAPPLRTTFDARKLDAIIDRNRSKIERTPRNASFDADQRNRLHVIPAAPAIRLSSRLTALALMEAAASRDRVGILPLDRSEAPALGTDEALGLGITELVSSFTTHHPCCRPRVANIHRIADLLDGTIVKPGETFSVNKYLGPRTRSKGFVPAPTIELGEMVDTVGGGISQFATTFFNALFYGGYDILERQPHTYYFPRYPMGHEATLSYPKPDLAFRNDTAAGVLIKCEYGKTFIRVKLYGNNGGRKVKARVSRRERIVDPPIEYIANSDLETDEEKVKQAGGLGWSVIVARILTEPDGSKREEKRRVIYQPRVRRVEVHPCRIPEGEDGYTGEECPESETPEDEDESTGEDLPPDAAVPPDDVDPE